MNEHQLAGGVQQLKGEGEAAVGGVFGDAKLPAEGAINTTLGVLRSTIGDGRASLEPAGHAHLRGNQPAAVISRAVQDHVAPALTRAAASADDVAHQVNVAVADYMGRASAAIQERPFQTIGLIAAIGYLLARISRPVTYVYRK